MAELTDTIRNTVKQFLFGSTNIPDDLTDISFLSNGPRSVSTPLAEFMSSGGGRFVLPATFDIVREFFSSNIPPDPNGPLVLDKAGIRSALGYSPEHDLAGYIRQLDLSDGIPDHAERTFVFNSGRFQLDNSVRFVVLPDGSKYIENITIYPVNQNDNFDLTGGGWITALGNILLQGLLDPSEIGKTVSLNFTGEVSSLPTINNYTADDLLTDLARISSWEANPIDYAALLPAVIEISNALFEEGITRFLDDENRPVVYFSNDGGITKVDTFPATMGNLSKYAENGIVLVGAHTDTIFDGRGDVSTQSLNVYLGGTGYDEFINLGHMPLVSGGDGDDTFNLDAPNGALVSGGLGDDQFISTGDGSALFWGGDGSDTFEITATAENPVSIVFAYVNELDAESFLLADPEYVLNYYANAAVDRKENESLFVIVNFDSTDKIVINGEELSDFEYTALGESTYYGADISYRFAGFSDGIHHITTNYLNDDSDFGRSLNLFTSFSNPSYGTFELDGLIARLYGTTGSELGFDVTTEERGAFETHTGFIWNENPNSIKFYDHFDPLQIVDEDWSGLHFNKVNGTSDDDVLSGTAGRDRVFGRSGKDTLIAGSGEGDDHYDGGAGEDTIRFSSTILGVEVSLAAGYAFGDETGTDTIVNVENVVGGAGNDTIFGNLLGNILTGGRGSDYLSGGAGNDEYIYYRGDGSDVIEEGEYGGSADILRVGGVNGFLETSLTAVGDDLLIEIFETAPAALDGGSILIKNQLRLDGNFGVETIYDGSGNIWSKQDIFDFLGVQPQPTLILGTPGDDILIGTSGNDIINGGDGNDWLVGDTGADTFVFTIGSGADGIADFTPGVDKLEIRNVAGADFGQLMAAAQEWGGNSWIYISPADVIVLHGVALASLNQSDFVFTTDETQEPSRYEILGTPAADELYGSAGADHLFGFDGDDELHGLSGDDVLEGGAGEDWLVGGAGNDVFLFRPGFGQDGIDDFEIGSDKIQVIGQGMLDFQTLISNSQEWGGNSWLYVSPSDLIVVHGVGLSALSENDFRFVQ